METGICLFAYNNDQIDYVRLAVVCALHIKANMKHNNISLITSAGDTEWLEQHFTEAELDDVFDQIIITKPEHTSNVRQHHDSPWTTFNCQFKNSNKHEVFKLSPYDKTLMVDIDYLINNNNLDYIFDTEIALAMYNDAHNINGAPVSLQEQHINTIGIPMWWSTVIYFDKSDQSKMFFDLWEHIADNYDYYSFLYGFPNKLFRTDFCVSIAIHILNGMQPGNLIHEFVDKYLVNSVQQDDIVQIDEDGKFIFLANDLSKPWVNYLQYVEGTNVHVMNKRSIMRHYDDFLELYL